jgi:hypothetical protein
MFFDFLEDDMTSRERKIWKETEEAEEEMELTGTEGEELLDCGTPEDDDVSDFRPAQIQKSPIPVSGSKGARPAAKRTK